MKYLLALSIIFTSHNVYSQNEDLEDLFAEDAPLLVEPISPFKQTTPNSNLISVDEYCICKCIKKGQDLKKAKFFKGKKQKRGCLCECAV